MAAVNLQFLVDVLNVVFHRFQRNIESDGYLFVGEPFFNGFHYLRFARSQFFLQVIYILVLINYQIFYSLLVTLNIWVFSDLSQCFKNQQRKIYVLMTVQATDVLFQHIALQIRPYIPVFIVVNQFIDTLQVQAIIQKARF